MQDQRQRDRIELKIEVCSSTFLHVQASCRATSSLDEEV